MKNEFPCTNPSNLSLAPEAHQSTLWRRNSVDFSWQQCRGMVVWLIFVFRIALSCKTYKSLLVTGPKALTTAGFPINDVENCYDCSLTLEERVHCSALQPLAVVRPLSLGLGNQVVSGQGSGQRQRTDA